MGVPLPGHIVDECKLQDLDEIRMLGRRQIGDEEYLLYCSHIVDREAGHVGADILVMNDVSIENIVESTLDDLGCYAIVSDGRIIYWPHGGHNVITVGVLEAYLANGEIDESHNLRWKKPETPTLKPLLCLDIQATEFPSQNAIFFSRNSS